ncbi:MAG: hypothetical protein OXC92_01305 [Flavobacteriaceae bacterium]|nr:hypothetical protein [Flavobacteriaceae bacterium]
MIWKRRGCIDKKSHHACRNIPASSKKALTKNNFERLKVSRFEAFMDELWGFYRLVVMPKLAADKK